MRRPRSHRAARARGAARCAGKPRASAGTTPRWLAGTPSRARAAARNGIGQRPHPGKGRYDGHARTELLHVARYLLKMRMYASGAELAKSVATINGRESSTPDRSTRLIDLILLVPRDRLATSRYVSAARVSDLLGHDEQHRGTGRRQHWAGRAAAGHRYNIARGRRHGRADPRAAAACQPRGLQHFCDSPHSFLVGAAADLSRVRRAARARAAEQRSKRLVVSARPRGVPAKGTAPRARQAR